MGKELPEAAAAGAVPSHVTIRTTLKKLQTFTEVSKTMKSLYGTVPHVSSSTNALASSLKHPDSNGGTNVEGSKKLLCVWDVDDTLVTSGVPGVRQCPMFTENELLSLFGSGPARHLLLSRGSIDDVFASGGAGKLEFLSPFFLSGGNPLDGHVGKVQPGCSNLFVCSSPPKVRSSGGAGAANSKNLVVRIATIRAPRENPKDAERFLSETAEPPRCSSEVRWLVMRPSLWGISLASLSNFIAPSAHTAFFDGSVFQKMDIVRSLAASGIWDTVFFIDNDLNEIGLVRPGLNIEDYYRMQSLGRLSRFFQSDLLLLQVSAELAKRRQGMGHSSVNEGPMGASAPVSSKDGKERSERESRINCVNAEFPTFQLPVVMDLGDNSTSSLMTSQPPSTRVVELVVAHLHLDEMRYRRIRKASNVTIGADAKEMWHPVFRTGPACTDEDYFDLMANFALYEDEVKSYGLEAKSQLWPVPGWEPSVDVVTHVMYERPTFPRRLSHQYRNICHHITTNLIELCGPRLSEKQQYALREEANHLYRHLIRRQPVIDPLLIANLANSLFSAFTSEHHLPRSLGDTLKKEVYMFLKEAQPEEATVLRGCIRN
ncbi:hypothetical protein TraAM80_08968 [Trypanosoma rangeli]|uniref:Uncharacterized protein n=1 Tax=Trypanosoma rangeli TaxID=5698 RepID=A0A3R7M2E0_TRYRA|nr:uncharacterized protein TraAM80_08968 [Trypanosoma rangeli]RNE98091.1 hypothetical protein TraAM80_08968 [Trypanosoma rangeli]|eukprot:RNE98091.1 hypothetical protein TraAM80_08968 [Trypanosoma rangeli]